MEECVIDQLRMCIIHMLRSSHGSLDKFDICLSEIIEQRDNALFFKSDHIVDMIARSYNKIFNNNATCVSSSKFNESDIGFQKYLTEAKIAFIIEPERWTILSFNEAYKLLALLKLEGY